MSKKPARFSTPEPGIRCVLAANASPMTYWGTNTFVLGSGKVAVIDPGPDDANHLQNILNTLKPGEVISHIFVTHSHVDHSPLAPALSNATGACVHAFGGASAGRSAVMNRLVEQGLTGGGEGIDHGFAPDKSLKDGQTITGENWHLTAIWTPGHIGNHMCFAWDDRLFCGDHVMGWASSLVSPPDGDLTDFMASVRKLMPRRDRVFYPGHGAPIIEPAARLEWLLNHRLSREKSILATLGKGPATVRTLTRQIYHDTAPALLPAAERNVLAHLVDLIQSDRVTAVGEPFETAQFKLC